MIQTAQTVWDLRTGQAMRLLALLTLVAAIGCSDPDTSATDTIDDDPADAGPRDAGGEGDGGIDPEPDVPEEDVEELLGPGELCAENTECTDFLCFFIAGVDQGFCSSFCLEADDCPDSFDCVFLPNEDDEIAKVCVPDDLCIDEDEDGYGTGPGCLGRDCDDANAERNPAQTEVCDNIDNDCDEVIDDNPTDANSDCDTGLPGICSNGLQRCFGGVLSCDPVRFGSPEICDGQDNDCDGDTDEDDDGEPIAATCYLGPEGTEGVGVCQPGARVCVDGQISDCLGQVLPFTELCDGLDNDCDGEIDEDNPSDGVACDTGEPGVCRQGQTRCEEGGEVVCIQLDAPSEEICDGIDNDCDGDIDEDEDGELLAQSCYEGEEGTEDVGPCLGGVRTCVDGAFGRCLGQILPDDELCDGLDNNCNGEPDEGNPAGGQICSTGLLGVCARGETVCAEEGLSCDPIVGALTEFCDNQDNDCDGDVDEDEDGEPLARGCYNGPDGTDGVGICTAGQQLCQGGNFGGCVGEVRPGVEVCDGVDNDCNGTPDDGNPGGGIACSTGLEGICAAGLTLCEDGGVACVQQAQPGVEICDGLDNDCDGLVDEGEDDQPLARGCYNGPDGTDGVGICTAGQQLCQGGNFGGCVGEVRPGVEVCDGLDNNCDGDLDEGSPGAGVTCSTGLEGVCAEGVTACNEGGDIVCVQRTQAGAEVCDGLDNDCDGFADEGEDEEPLAQDCYNGPDGTAGQGICQVGRQTCQGGRFTGCVGEVRPGVELCDGVDNDCDGEADNGNPGGGVVCSTGETGVCAAGLTACLNGAVGCVQQQQAGPEVCDGLDNDCDGFADEGEDEEPLAQDCYNGPDGTAGQGICQVGRQTCQGGRFGGCVGEVRPGVELCDGVDNDCDGEADNGNPGGGVVCSTGETGVCAAGLTACLNGAVGCVQQQQPSAEACDGLDNDCDGDVDEDGNGDPIARGCFDGEPGQRNEGICEDGVEVCRGGQFGACEGQTLPQTEICDGVDNNCDGTPDSGNPGGGIACTTGEPGICATGQTACLGATIDCVRDNEPQDELCDGVDTDCDGNPDNGFDGLGQTCFAGQGVCRRAGVLVCNPDNRAGAPICDAEPAQGNNVEACDNQDDDCDGQIDEDYRDGNGVYNTANHCGGCGIDCNNLWPGGPELFNVVPTCEVAGNAALCDFECADGFVDLDTIPDNGCEFSPDPGAIYVSTPANGGNDGDADCGTFDAPCATLAFGIQRAQGAGRERVRVSSGLYRESVALQPGIDLLGGHTPTNWSRNPQIHTTAINGQTLNPQGPDRMVVTAVGITIPTELSGFTINAENAAPGGNSIGVYILDSTDALVVRDNIVFAGIGGNGQGGEAGDSGLGGLNGSPGFDSQIHTVCPFGDPNCHDIPGGGGGARVCANPGGGTTNISGGTGGVSNDPRANARAGNGINGGTNLGGSGGLGGGHLLGRLINGSARCTILAPPAEPAPGLVGTPGTDGEGGDAANDTDGAFDTQDTQWRGVSGGTGDTGQHGGGGGGGGGAAGVDAFDQEGNLFYGATGGGGGSGGCGGFSGEGGTAGGGSFAIFIAFGGTGPLGPDLMPQIIDNRLIRGQGGQGGGGGNGGAGGDPGLGAEGGAGLEVGTFGFCLFDGAIGAEGGRGGHAGGGAGGTGGASFDLYIHNDNGHNPGYTVSNAFELPDNVGTSGAGGFGGSSSNASGGLGDNGLSGAFGNLQSVP